jgi:hypothetical protein
LKHQKKKKENEPLRFRVLFAVFDSWILKQFFFAMLYYILFYAFLLSHPSIFRLWLFSWLVFSVIITS